MVYCYRRISDIGHCRLPNRILGRRDFDKDCGAVFPSSCMNLQPIELDPWPDRDKKREAGSSGTGTES